MNAVTVLLVEDEAGEALLFEEYLREFPYVEFDLHRVETSADAVNWLQQSTPHVVVLDLTLPDCAGWETVARVHPHCGEATLVVHSGVEDEQLARRALRAGAQNYFIKGEVVGTTFVRLVLHAIERDLMRRALQRHRTAIHQSEARVRAVIENVADGVVVLSQDEVYLANRSARMLFDEVTEGIMAARLNAVDDEEEFIVQRGQTALRIHARANPCAWGEETARVVSLRVVGARQG